MLKIKDDIEFDVLKPFGFREEPYWKDRLIHKDYYNFKINTKKGSKDYRRIILSNRGGKAPFVACYDILFDLISAGIVEKVEDFND